MAVTQYIGARYVPIIFQNPDDNSNDWKAGIAYEPLTIVSYAGGSYTSKTAVPAGASNPVDAPEYWVAIGLYSGQTAINTNSITQIRHALAAATEAGYVCTSPRNEGDLVWISGALYECTAAVAVDEAYTEGINITPVSDALTTLINGLQQATSDISDIGHDVGTLQTDMTAAQADITDLNGYNNFSTRRIACLSDSYGLTPTVNDSWIGKLQTYLGISNSNFWRTQENATGFVGLSPTTFLTQAQTLAGTMTADEKAALTDFVIGGGMNDATYIKNGGSAATLRTAAAHCLQYIRTTFPNAKIWVFMPAWRLDSTWHPYIRAALNVYQQCIRFTTRACFIDNIYWLHRQALLDSTLYHPNATGAFCIAESIASAMLGGSSFCDCATSDETGWITPALTATANVTDFGITGAQQMCNNGIAYMKWQNITFKPVANLTPLAQVEIADFSDGIMSAGGFLEAYEAYVNIQGVGPGMILIYNNRIRLSNFSNTTINAGTAVTVNFGSLCGPIML